jgi:predicted dehydrogenase
MTITPLRIGITGANAQRGWATDAHLGALRALPGLVIQAVSARTLAIAQEAQALYGAVTAYDDSLALARDPDVDVVAVTVKVPEHRAIVLAAIAAGKHVYCEWPLGRDIAEAREMAAAAQAAGVHVAIGLQGANSLAVRHAARLVREGVIGRPLSLRVVSPTAGWGAESPAHYAYLQDKRNGATLATIAGGHTLAAIEAVVGDYADVSALASIVQGQMQISGTVEVVARTCADHLIVTGRHVGGCVSTLEVVGGVIDLPFVFELRGTAGTLSITGGHIGGFQAGRLAVTTTPSSVAQPSATAPALGGPPANVSELWARFAEDIRNGTTTVPDFDRAVRLTRLLDTIDASSDEGRRLTVDY